MTEENWSREQERQPHEKAFALKSSDLQGQKFKFAYSKNKGFLAAEENFKRCMIYAQSYSVTMMNRLLQEEPDYFEDKPVSKDEFTVHLMSNLCLEQRKQKNAAFAEATAQLIEENHLKDRIRRLNNGGDRFHPYL